MSLPLLSSVSSSLCLGPGSSRVRAQPKITQISVASPSTPSPRHVTQEESISIRGTISCWKRGDFDFGIDEAVRLLLPESIKRKSYAREVYTRFVEEIKAVQDEKILIDSREALYAASVFSKYAERAQEFNALETSYIDAEKVIMKVDPNIIRER